MGIRPVYIILILFIVTPVHLERIQFDGEGCDKLNLVVANQECPSVGIFPTPGDCTVFFKCLLESENKPMVPFLEYCGIGYNFINGSGCVSNPDKSDCPQFHCIISSDLSSVPHLDSQGSTDGNSVHQTESKLTTVAPARNSSKAISNEEINEELFTQNYDSSNHKKADEDIKSKDKKSTLPTFETPVVPIPYKSHGTAFSYNLVLLSSFTLLNTYVQYGC